MKKLKLAAFIMAAAMAAVPFTGCRSTAKEIVISGDDGYAALDDIATDKNTADLGETVSANNIEYTLHNVIDTGYEQDGYKYIFLDVTLKNTSDTDYEANSINYFYIKFNDEKGTEFLPSVRGDSYARNNIKDYQRLSGLPAGSEYHGYIGFAIEEELPEKFIVGCFPSGENIDDKTKVFYTEITAKDIVAPPEGMLK